MQNHPGFPIEGDASECRFWTFRPMMDINEGMMDIFLTMIDKFSSMLDIFLFMMDNNFQMLNKFLFMMDSVRRCWTIFYKC
ncbi:MAG: hypothetical protein C6P37_14260 [Caldibacillus debilis]|uniref:Uncharacterized protein n=1 Tax=Caldibacillus debilis TaxID=301148 RepID=A0A3E0JZT3_9BACI|nr:MAG: hypothetical protein C6W57_16330 [Caldibacillus debilis]REJ25902.1 MAG: hypothetical protein C6P37_14260 [Caldibacillus debilis]REJ28782.1 MAG: hypothetical protein C6W56_07550 [Caldibacillus debilis]